MKTITFSNDNADERYAGHIFELVKCKWIDEHERYEEAEDGLLEGIYAPGEGLMPFFYPPEDFGTITEE
jgi:hypothetical protein